MSQATPDTATDLGIQADDDDSDGGLDLDTKFHLLQNERRRLALRYLLGCETDEDGAVEMRDVAEQVAAWEHDTTVRQLDSDQRQRVYVGLYQSHLPKLDEHDVIEYNQSRGRVVPKEGCHELEPYLENAPGAEGEELRSAQPTATGPAPGAATPAESDSQSTGKTHLLIGVAGLIPLAALASQAVDSVIFTAAVLAVIVATTAFVSGGLRQHVESVLRN